MNVVFHGGSRDGVQLDDRFVPPAHARRLAGQIPGAEPRGRLRRPRG